jgi:CCR4-NOT transcription complex subunit 7/8
LIEAGIDFNKLKEKGINVKDFAEYWVSCGIVFNKNIKWIVFHGSSDFAYLLKITHGDGLPGTSSDFYRLMKIYYPNIYDMKYFIKDLPVLKDVGLSRLGNEFDVMYFL